MPRVLITVVGLYLALIAVTAMADDTPEYVDPDARHPGFTGACQDHEALNLGGTIYLADPGAHQPRFLRDAVAGAPHATVAARRPDADACEGELEDGASTYLDPGATLHPVDDWATTFRLVSVQPSGRLVLYQAAALVESLLGGRIDPTAIDLTASSPDADDTFSIAVDLPDGTGLRLTFACDTMTSTTGIVLSEEAVTDRERERLCPTDDLQSR